MHSRAFFAALVGSALLGPLAQAQSLTGSPVKRAGVVLPGGSNGLPRLMPLGDSLTEGIGAFAGYRKRLWEQLVLEGTPWDFVGSKQVNSQPSGMDPDHEGHGGYRVSDLIGTGLQPSYPDQLAYWVGQAAPDLVLLHAGTNDIFKAFTWSQGIDDVDTLLDIIWSTAPACHIILAEILPTKLPGFNLQIESFNRGLREVTRKRLTLGQPMGWVDMYNGVGEFEADDNVHPTGIVYAAMADVWKLAIDRLEEAVVLPPMLGDPLPVVQVASSPVEPGYEPLQAVNGSDFDDDYSLALAENAPGTDQPASWRSADFDVFWLDAMTPAPAPFQAPMLELRLAEESHVTALHLWNGRGFEFLTADLELDLRVYDSFGSVRIETGNDNGTYTDRGVFDLRQPPRVRKAPGELLEVDWKGVRVVRLSAETLDSATIAPDNAPGRARVAMSEVRVYGTSASTLPASLVLREEGRVGIDLGVERAGCGYMLWIPPAVETGVGRILGAGRLDVAGRAHWDGSELDAFAQHVMKTVNLEFLVDDELALSVHPVPFAETKLFGL